MPASKPSPAVVPVGQVGPASAAGVSGSDPLEMDIVPTSPGHPPGVQPAHFARQAERKAAQGRRTADLVLDLKLKGLSHRLVAETLNISQRQVIRWWRFWVDRAKGPPSADRVAAARLFLEESLREAVVEGLAAFPESAGHGAVAVRALAEFRSLFGLDDAPADPGGGAAALAEIVASVRGRVGLLADDGGAPAVPPPAASDPQPVVVSPPVTAPAAGESSQPADPA